MKSIAIITILITSMTIHAEDRLISKASILRLQEQVEEIDFEESTSAKRRLLKKSLRQAESILKRHSEADNRFLVLDLYLNIQKSMFELQPSKSLRESIFETAQALLKAPNEFALQRLNGDAMFIQIKLSEEKASLNQTAYHLALFADRYRGTVAEPDCLMVASQLAKEIGYEPLVKGFRQNLSERYSHDPRVSSFLTQTFNIRTPLIVQRELQQYKGAKISFPPVDTSILCFWSKDTPDFQTRIETITKLQQLYPKLKVYSMNLDEMRDAGLKILKEMNLNWIPMVIPNGVENELYKLFNQANAFCVAVIDTNGEVRLEGAVTKTIPGHLHWKVPLQEIYETSLECPRRRAIKHSLFSADFLIRSLSRKASSLPQSIQKELEGILAPLPQFYRLSYEEKINQYLLLEQVCKKGLENLGSSKDTWILLKARIIALIALWKHTSETGYLSHAIEVADQYVTKDSPFEIQALSAYSSSILSFVQGQSTGIQTLESYFKTIERSDESQQGLALALLLSAQTNSIDAFDTLRKALLEKGLEDESLKSLMTYLYDSSSAKELLGTSQLKKSEAANFDDFEREVLQGIFKLKDGSSLTFPDSKQEQLTALFFVEKASYIGHSDMFDSMLNVLSKLKKRPLNDLKIVLVSKLEDSEYMNKKFHNRRGFSILYLENERWRTLSQHLGFVAMDLRPNVAIVHSSGRVMGSLSGMSRMSDRSSVRRGPFGHVHHAGIYLDEIIRKYDQARFLAALERKDYQEVIDRSWVLMPPIYKTHGQRYPDSRSKNAQYRKIVWGYMQLKDWRKALDTMNKINTLSNTSKMAKRVTQHLFEDQIENDLLMRSVILDHLGKKRQAGSDRHLIKQQQPARDVRLYDLYETREICIERRKQAWNLIDQEEWEKALKLVKKNIAIHEAEAERFKTSCRICIEQHDAMKYYVQDLELIEKTERAEAMKAMIGYLQCPSWRKQVRVKGFPVGRLPEAGSGPSRMLYMKTYMLGGGRANKHNRDIRIGFGEDMWMHYLVLKGLGKTEEASEAQNRAIALVWPLNPDSLRSRLGKNKSYTSLIQVDEGFWKSKSKKSLR